MTEESNIRVYRPISPVEHIRRRVSRLMQVPGASAFVTMLVTFLFFSVIAEHFLTWKATWSYLTIAGEIGVVAVGVTLLMTAGRFDLSVGSTFGVSTVIVAWLMQNGLSAPLATLMGLVAASLIGLLNGLFVAYTLAPSLVITLASSMAWRGVVYWITEGFPIAVNVHDPFFRIFNWTLPGGFMVSLIWMFVFAFVFHFGLFHTPIGNWTSAIGGNPGAARKSGVAVNRVLITLYVLVALAAATAGMLQLTRFGSVDALRGQFIEFRIIAAIVIGGTRLQGGVGSVWGTVFGVIAFGMFQVGLQLAKVPSYFYESLIGIVLLVAALTQEHSLKVVKSWR